MVDFSDKELEVDVTISRIGELQWTTVKSFITSASKA